MTKPLTKIELYRHAADNLEKGLPELDRVEYHDGSWRPTRCITLSEVWNGNLDKGKYRIRPKTKLVNGFQVPDISFVPEAGETYIYPTVGNLSFFGLHRYDHDQVDKRISDASMAYPDTDEGKAAAKAHALAILGIDPNGGDE